MPARSPQPAARSLFSPLSTQADASSCWRLHPLTYAPHAVCGAVSPQAAASQRGAHAGSVDPSTTHLKPLAPSAVRGPHSASTRLHTRLAQRAAAAAHSAVHGIRRARCVSRIVFAESAAVPSVCCQQLTERLSADAGLVSLLVAAHTQSTPHLSVQRCPTLHTRSTRVQRHDTAHLNSGAALGTKRGETREETRRDGTGPRSSSNTHSTTPPPRTAPHGCRHARHSSNLPAVLPATALSLFHSLPL